MPKSNLNWENNCLFALANIGDVNLFKYWLDKQKLNIDAQDEEGDTPLHYAVRGGHIDLVMYLLEKGAIISWNENRQSPLQLAYKLNQPKISYEITQSIIKGKNAIDESQKLDFFINNFIKLLIKNYLNRSIFIRFSAKHNERAKALIVAVRLCSSVNEFKDLLNNQLNLFKNTPTPPLSNEIIDKRWSEVIKNKPLNVNKSQFYNTLNTFVTKRLYNNIDNKSFRNIHQR